MISMGFVTEAASGCRGAMPVVWACAAITIAVCTAMVYSVISFRKSEGGATAHIPSRSAEILWSLIPIGIFLGIAVPAVRALLFIGDHCGP